MVLPMSDLIFLKLGGSLITDKRQPRTPRLDTLEQAAEAIRQALVEQPELRLLIGHGAGSFAHVPAKKYGTRQGVHTREAWLGFAEVWWEAAALNRLVMDALHKAGLAAIAMPPSAAVTAREGQVEAWDLAPLQAALEAGLIPVVFGDVIFDRERGGTILSTEDLFGHLARAMQPKRILLAGIEAGVWADFPACTRLTPMITPQNFPEIAAALGGSNATDVTGGMASKVQQSLELVRQVPGLEVAIFSGETPDNLRAALLGQRVGTTLRAAA